MKTFTLLLLASLLATNNLLAQAPQESPELREASALTTSALKFFYEEKYDKAVSEAKKALKIRERLLPHTDSRIAASLVYPADIYLVKRDFRWTTVSQRIFRCGRVEGSVLTNQTFRDAREGHWGNSV